MAPVGTRLGMVRHSRNARVLTGIHGAADVSLRRGLGCLRRASVVLADSLPSLAWTLPAVYDWPVTRSGFPWRVVEVTPRRTIGVFCIVLGMACGCGDLFAPQPAPLFSTPLTIDGTSVDPAIIDTGGGYELMLRDAYDLRVVDFAEVVAFGGREIVGITEGFPYSVGGWNTTAEAALVGPSVCDCNGLGFHFFKKTGAVLGIDYRDLSARFLTRTPAEGLALTFQQPPEYLDNFDSAFVEVEVKSGGESLALLGLLDTGTNASVMRRGLLGKPTLLQPNRLFVTITHERLGTVAAQLGLFDTDGLPDLIIGTDIMRVWSDRWYFSFTHTGGSVTVFPRSNDGTQGKSAIPTAPR